MNQRHRLAMAISSLVMGTIPLATMAQSQLDEIVVTGSRGEKQINELPLAISLINQNDLQLGRQELGLDESLARVPGLFLQNRYNFSQDLRVSIRGFGSRASFGIRGIKVFADGIPVTLPDGQSGTDDLDLGSMGSVEVVRGPSASLYGTAAGGVISVNTEIAPEDPFLETKLTFGRWGHERYQVKTGGQNGKLNYLINASYLELDGYRDFSEVEHKLINTKFIYDLDDSSKLTAIFNMVDSPMANDSGGVTLADVASNRTQAQARNLSSNAGESFDQQRVGLIWDKQINESQSFTLRAYAMNKDFQSFLPIGTHIPFVGDDGVVEFERSFFGGGGIYNIESTLFGLPNLLSFGVDVDIQKDDRTRYLNNAGIKGAKVFDQAEEAESVGVYFRNEINLSPTLALSLAGRFDNLDLSVDDNYLANGDQSGAIDFSEFNPSVGLMWNATDTLNLYTNYATAFETPTFTELGSPAQDLNVNLGGFNNVRAQEADSIEIGAKGLIGTSLFYDVALFKMDVKNEITNIVSIANRAFFENADTDRQGLEAQIQAKLSENFDLTMAYTYSDFEFTSFDTQPGAVGARVPGIPEQQLFAELKYMNSAGAYVIVDALYVGKFYATNNNNTKVDSYVVSNLRLGSSYDYNGTKVSPFIGINNLLDEDYFSNVRINAFGGRAYEPAPERHLYAGVAIRF